MKLNRQIPPLSGPVLRGFQIVWWSVFLVVVGQAILVLVPEQRREMDGVRAAASVGIHVASHTQEGIIARPLVPAARAAGIRDADLLVAIDGHPFPALESERAELLAGGADGSVAVLTVRHLDGSEEAIPIRRNSAYLGQAYAGSGLTFESGSWFIFGLTTIYALVLVVVSFALMLKRPREPVAALLAMGWTFSGLNTGALGLPIEAQYLPQSMLFLCIPLGLSLFPDSRFVSIWNWLVIPLIPAMIIGYILWNSIPGFPNFYTPAMLLNFAVLGIAVIVRFRRTPLGAERQQLKFFALGLVILSICMMSAALVGLLVAPEATGPVYAWKYIVFNGLVTTGFMALGIGILVSLLRYRLYDAESTISRSVALGALTLALLSIFAASQTVIEVLGQEWFGEDLGPLAAGIGAGLAAALIVPLNKRLNEWAERRFQTEVTRLRDEYPPLVADLRETMQPDAIAAHALAQIMPTLRTGRGVLMIDREPMALRGMTLDELDGWRATRDPPEAPGLHTDSDDPVLPTRLSLEAPGHGRIGWLLLGPRPDGSTVGKDEREALEAIADPLARALQVAREREARENERAKVREAHERRLDLLEEALQRLAGEEPRHAG